LYCINIIDQDAQECPGVTDKGREEFNTSLVERKVFIMENESYEKVFDTKTALRLLDPRESGIPLLPLSDVEQHQSTQFWAAVFFGIFAATLGSLVSLVSTTYSNYPVVYLLGLFLGSYFIFFVVFSARGFIRWRKLREKSLGSVSWSKESLTERIAVLERRDQLYKVHRDVGMHVFDGVYTLSFDDFNRKVDGLLPFEPDDPRRKKFNQKLLAEDIITIDKTDPENWTVTYNADFEVTV
jgi:hypothetical protein